jgi:hypothetical protein
VIIEFSSLNNISGLSLQAEISLNGTAEKALPGFDSHRSSRPLAWSFEDFFYERINLLSSKSLQVDARPQNPQKTGLKDLA